MIWINFDTGEGTVVVNPSCKPGHLDCSSAFPITFGNGSGGSTENDFALAASQRNGTDRIIIGTAFHQALYKIPGVPGINDALALNVSGTGTIHGEIVGPDFPSVEIYHRPAGNSGTVDTVYLGQEGGSVIVPRLWGYFGRSDRF